MLVTEMGHLEIPFTISDFFLYSYCYVNVELYIKWHLIYWSLVQAWLHRSLSTVVGTMNGSENSPGLV